MWFKYYSSDFNLSLALFWALPVDLSSPLWDSFGGQIQDLHSIGSWLPTSSFTSSFMSALPVPLMLGRNLLLSTYMSLSFVHFLLQPFFFHRFSMTHGLAKPRALSVFYSHQNLLKEGKMQLEHFHWSIKSVTPWLYDMIRKCPVKCLPSFVPKLWPLILRLFALVCVYSISSGWLPSLSWHYPLEVQDRGITFSPSLSFRLKGLCTSLVENYATGFSFRRSPFPPLFSFRWI